MLPIVPVVSVVPGSERIERYEQQILAALRPAEVESWHQAVTAAQADGTFFIAQAYHCAVATKPGGAAGDRRRVLGIISGVSSQFLLYAEPLGLRWFERAN